MGILHPQLPVISGIPIQTDKGICAVTSDNRNIDDGVLCFPEVFRRFCSDHEFTQWDGKICSNHSHTTVFTFAKQRVVFRHGLAENRHLVPSPKNVGTEIDTVEIGSDTSSVLNVLKTFFRRFVNVDGIRHRNSRKSDRPRIIPVNG